MTYKDQFVAEIKVNGKVLRLKDDAATLPFGSEYSILLKNLNSRRVSVKISIDGQDALEYSSLILDANESTELQGFLSGNVVRNRFKFIQKTKEIQEHRGDKIDDGFIRIEFAFEKEEPEIIKKTIIHEDHIYRRREHPYFNWNYNNWFNDNSSVKYGSATTFTSCVGQSINSSGDNTRGICEQSINMVQSSDMCLGIPDQDEGITVKGSECNQEFRYTVMGELEQSRVIIIKLRGMTSTGGTIEIPVTVQTKLECKTCGTKSKSSFKFCPNCGTYLE